MKLILCLLLLWYFHFTHKQANALSSGRDAMQSGDPAGPFFAGRGRRGGGMEERLSQSNGDNSDAVEEINDNRHLVGSDTESKLKLGWPFTPLGMERLSLRMNGLSPSSSRSRAMSLEDPTPYYIWYNIRKKQSNIKTDSDDSPFMAVRG